MKKRPLSVTIIGWFLIVTSLLSLLSSIFTINSPAAQELMAKTPLPLLVQHILLYLGLFLSILAAVFMLRGANWARLLYIIWTGAQLLLILATSPVKLMILPAVVIYALFTVLLFRPSATAYFKPSAAPSEA